MVDPSSNAMLAFCTCGLCSRMPRWTERLWWVSRLYACIYGHHEPGWRGKSLVEIVPLVLLESGYMAGKAHSGTEQPSPSPHGQHRLLVPVGRGVIRSFQFGKVPTHLFLKGQLM